VAATLPRERPLAVIEIGGGTGATTAHVLPHLPASSRYLFTDLGASLVARAREKFADRGVAFAPLDIARPPAAQGIAIGTWDVAIAANVLHATPDLVQSLGHARELLAPGGLLLLVENTGRLAWGDLTFGLTPGMWNFRDTALRDHALLYQAQWRTLLATAGFEGIEILTPGEPDRGGVSQQCVILARRAARRHWLLAGGTPQLRDALAAELRRIGHACSLADGDAIPAGVTDVACLVEGTLRDPANPRPVLEPILALAQAVRTRAAATRLAIVATGAYAAANGEPTQVASPAQCTLPGFARTVAAELPEARLRMIDLDPSLDAAAQAAGLAAELVHGNEAEIALRAGARHRPALRAPRAAGARGPALRSRGELHRHRRLRRHRPRAAAVDGAPRRAPAGARRARRGDAQGRGGADASCATTASMSASSVATFRARPT
jgi:SAM-dependent methyltransferase